ncbi:MAG: Ig-like domain-containing protein, partial [Bifidobacteriaceae bacterium]|jgi:hypothetical protein|nr:Ig-like domain-containing protein [Bifidobacteriaceae bacterium]
VPKAASATTVKWRSSNPKAFRVDAAGRLTVVGHGRAWIKARYQGHNAQILVSSSNAPWPK